MTIRSSVQALPRTLVSGSLRAVRLPLSAAERVVHQQHNAQWPPTLAYESFEAGVETLVGSLVRDPALVEKGRLRQRKLAQLRRAGELSALADQEQARADEQLQARLGAVQEQRQEAEQRAQERKQELEQQAEARRRKVATKAARQAAAAREAESAQEKAIARRARTAEASALAAESRALAVAQQALAAEETVDVIDKTIEGTKAARKGG